VPNSAGNVKVFWDNEGVNNGEFYSRHNNRHGRPLQHAARSARGYSKEKTRTFAASYDFVVL